MRNHITPILTGLAAVFFLSSCKEDPETFAIHSPVYPTGSQAVTFNLNRISGDVSSVELYESISNVSSSGVLSGTTAEALLHTWPSPAFPLSFTRSSGYGTNKMVKYRFKVTGNGHTYNHSISFATGPYPVANAAVPVYVVGDADRVLNCVFVRDSDLSTSLFYTHVGRDIDSAFHREDWVRRFRNSYNFYVNPLQGRAGNFNIGTSHIPPANSANLSFAQSRIILHASDRRDFSSGGYVGTEYYNRGTILHETGHSIYGMADEYGGNGSGHWQNDRNPNNWSSLAGAKNDASGAGKTAADAVQISGETAWWKLCNGSCMMLNTGLTIYPYDAPCRNRIFQRIVDRASDNW